ncbi:ABC transporter permease [Olivibacter domesticus]|uniref:Putative ABC transport system permease protein n=1 Tax=Olivibacter domesticus TaxID=407022 RepID=A0A1H7JSE1_OLID1|nr:ABC transporter permease [Olivibacter domesticus]SEK77493.1 putative ABC transport system permease protein [Olivibacter domesticus]
MAACVLIYKYVSFETSYDSFHHKGNRIYRLVTDIKTPTEDVHFFSSAFPYAPNMVNDLPEVASAVRFFKGDYPVRKGSVKFMESVLFADSSLFEVFDFSMIEGNAATALANPYSIVLTRSGAKKYFGEDNPIGKTILFGGDASPSTVTGVIEDIPENSQLQTDLFVSMTTFFKYKPMAEQAWGDFPASTYLLLKSGSSIDALQEKIPAFLEKHAGEEMKKLQLKCSLVLEPLQSVYLHSTRGGYIAMGAGANVYTFSLVAAFILIIACINFINMATARSAERAKEVGVKKVTGAQRGQLVWQFITESLFMALLAFVLSLCLTYLALPYFNQLAGKTISLSLFENVQQVYLLTGVSILIGLLAGIYPSLVLSSFKPAEVLKGNFSTGSKGNSLRKALVVFQFTISIFLIAATIVVYNQLNYMRSYDIGFNKDQTIVIDTHGDPAKKAYRQSLSVIPGIGSTTMSSGVPGGGVGNAYSEIENKNGVMQITGLDIYGVDFDFIPQYGLKMIAGRPFSSDYGSDSTQAMVVNEAAVKLLGFQSPQDVIGKRFDQWGRQGKIIGVVQDFNYQTLEQNIKPLSFRLDTRGTNLISVKTTVGDIPRIIENMREKWNQLLPQIPFSYYFLDEQFDQQYRAFEQFGQLFVSFAALAIFISCLGLLGLISYSTLQRTKEIGIRKVLGASVSNIVKLISRDYLKLVVLSFLIATPIAWFAADRWLQNFAYRGSISWYVFFIAGLLALLIAAFTISWQTMKAAWANPVKSLRTD